LHFERSKLKKAKKVTNQKIGILEEKCVDIQLLKFGQMIDLQLLDNTVSLAKGEVELEEQIRDMERRKHREMEVLGRHKRRSEDSLLGATTRNTELLESISQIAHKIFDIEQTLKKATEDGLGFNIFIFLSFYIEFIDLGASNNEPAIRRELEERNRLISLVKLQAREIEGLRMESQLLSYKGPVPQSQLEDEKTFDGWN